jgi:hypothetical protein
MIPRGAIVVVSIFWLTSATPVCGPAQDVDGAIVVEEPKVVIQESLFNRLVFGGSANPPKGREGAEVVLANEIKAIDRVCSLSDAQRKKLQLAGRGDIKLAFERLGALREKFVGVPIGLSERNTVIQELQVLGIRLRGGLFDDNSLFRKTLRNALTDEQLSKYIPMERDQRLRKVEAVLQSWELQANGIKLSASKRKEVAKLLIDKARPPKDYGTHTHYVVLLQIAELEDEVRPMFDESQWELVSKQLVQARRIEPQLRQMGVWPTPAPMDDDEAKE